MSQNSPHLNLPYIQPAQAQKHVTHNEAVELLDMIVQLTVQDFDATTPTTNPPEGETWALGATPTGAWAGQTGMLATWRGGGWLFVTPQTGWRAYGVTPALIRVYDGTGWASTDQALVLENLTGVGINATSDATNKLAVSSDATLLTHAGNGHQLKLNKAASGDTASLLFQSNWSGRAEMGLAGEDNFSIKVSADGTGFKDAIRIDGVSGNVLLSQGRVHPSRDSLYNLLPDSGRFMGAGANTSIPGTYAVPSYLSMRPGVVVSEYGKFIHDNTTHGGTAGQLQPDVATLVSKIRGTGLKRYGPEWSVLTITQTATPGGPITAFGETFGLTFLSPLTPIPNITTSGFYLKMVTGKALLPLYGDPVISCSVDGIERGRDLSPNHIITPAEGWVWCQTTQGSFAGLGYNRYVLTALLSANAVCRYALPKVIGGQADLSGLETMLNDRMYG